MTYNKQPLHSYQIADWHDHPQPHRCLFASCSACLEYKRLRTWQPHWPPWPPWSCILIVHQFLGLLLSTFTCACFNRLLCAVGRRWQHLSNLKSDTLLHSLSTWCTSRHFRALPILQCIVSVGQGWVHWDDFLCADVDVISCWFYFHCDQRCIYKLQSEGDNLFIEHVHNLHAQD